MNSERYNNFYRDLDLINGDLPTRKSMPTETAPSSVITTPSGFKVTTTWHNAGPHTIWGQLALKLGREPTAEEAKADVRRILREAREADLDRRGVTQEKNR